jgi:hypothetical protein
MVNFIFILVQFYTVRKPRLMKTAGHVAGMGDEKDVGTYLEDTSRKTYTLREGQY